MRIEFKKDLIKLLQELEDQNSYIAFEILSMIEPDSKYSNGLKIREVSTSKIDGCFRIKTDSDVSNDMKISKFISYFFRDMFGGSLISSFVKQYDSLKNVSDDNKGVSINVPDFSYNPRDPRSTFLSLTTKTYPHGHEDEVLDFLPDLNKDKVGNYYKIIGDNPTTMFTSHLDTADRSQVDTSLYSIIDDDEEYIVTDGNTILGSDDKSGITVMLYMMNHNIPGLYYFFIGEERGGIGSYALADIYSDVSYLKDINKCISFDRRNYYSVITQQMGEQCCSDEFGNALCDELNKSGLKMSLDTGGIYTDSASFIDLIPECTNISVGYFNEHTVGEYQNMTFLESLCESCVLVNWDKLPIKRKVGYDEDVMVNNLPFLNDVRDSDFNINAKIVTIVDRTYFKMEIDDEDISEMFDSLNALSKVLNKHNMDPDILIDFTELKIELK